MNKYDAVMKSHLEGKQIGNANDRVAAFTVEQQQEPLEVWVLLLSLPHSPTKHLEPWAKGYPFLFHVSHYCTLYYGASNHLISLQVIPSDGFLLPQKVLRDDFTQMHM